MTGVISRLAIFVGGLKLYSLLCQVNDEHVGLIMEALSHRRGEVIDMGPVPGNVGRTKLSLTCPSRYDCLCYSTFSMLLSHTQMVS